MPETRSYSVTAHVYHAAHEDPGDEYEYGSVTVPVRSAERLDLMESERLARYVRSAVCFAVWRDQHAAGRPSTFIGTINEVTAVLVEDEDISTEE